MATGLQQIFVCSGGPSFNITSLPPFPTTTTILAITNSSTSAPRSAWGQGEWNSGNWTHGQWSHGHGGPLGLNVGGYPNGWDPPG